MQPAKSGGVPAIVHGIETLAVVLERPSALPDLFRIGGEHATFTTGGKNLVLTERESSGIGEQTSGTRFVCGAEGLGAILNYLQMVFSGKLKDGIHVARPAGKMDGNNGLGPGRENGLDRLRCNVLSGA